MGTALVTGATSGLGLEAAWQLAAAGHDLVLVARREDRLAQVAREITQVAGVGVEVLPADLSTDEGVERVAARLRSGAPLGRRERLATGGAPCDAVPHTAALVATRCVDLLVNNAGFAPAQSFAGGDRDREEAALRVMVRAVMVLTHAALPGMVGRGHGAVLNVSSVAASTALGTYAAAKAWVRVFTEALATELVGTGVTATAVCPGMVRTDFFEEAGLDASGWPGPAWVPAQRVVAEALDAVRRGRVLVTPTARYKVVTAALRLGPRWAVRALAPHRLPRFRF